jgi:Domain of unknown function (DUF4394)/IPTL-CTERM motif
VKKTLVLAMAAVGLLGMAGAAHAELIYAVTSSNVLLSFDSATPGTVTTIGPITGLQAGENILGIDLRPATGQLYGLGSTSRLYTINPTTAAATQVGSGVFSTALSGTSFGFDFNPTVDRIRVVSDADQNLRLHPDTGAVAVVDTNLAYAAGDPNFGVNPNVVAAAYTSNFAGATSTTLFGIDSNLDIAVLQGSPDGTPISPNTGQLFTALPLFTAGPVLVDTSDAVGFDFSGPPTVGYLSLTPPTGAASSLYTVGAQELTLIGTIGTGFIVVDITVGVQGQGPTPTPTATATATPTGSPTLTVTADGAAPAEVPTLSGWAMAALMLLLGTFGYLLLRSSSA